MKTFRIGTRKSKLALVQSTQIQKLLSDHKVACELVKLESAGDKNKTVALYDMEPSEPGLFTRRLENALLAGEIDLAVHSMKDLPTVLPQGLRLTCIPLREDPADVLVISPNFYDPSLTLKIREKATIGTSSLRREANLKCLRPDLDVLALRGNVPTRIEAVRQGKVHAVVLAMAGLSRLEMKLDDLKCVPLDTSLFVPAPAQGALAIETREEMPEELNHALLKLHNPALAKTIGVERKVLSLLEGGCSLPLGAYCQKKGDLFQLDVFLGIYSKSGGHARHWKAYERATYCSKNPQEVIDKALRALSSSTQPMRT